MARALSAMLLPVSLGVAAGEWTRPEVPLRATGFTRYPDNVGDVTMAGRVSVGRNNLGTLVLFWDLELMGKDQICDESEDPSGEPDACGIAIYTGLSCDSVGAKYHNSAMPEDPWLHVTYKTHEGKATGRNIHVHTGYTTATLRDLTNRTVVVHDALGHHLACARLTPFNETGVGLVQTFSKFPGYKGALTVQGTVEVAQESLEGFGSGAAQALRFSLTGVDSHCVETADISAVPNACGIHIHAGRSCADALLVGPDLYDSQNILTSPWAPIQYLGIGQVATGVTTPVLTGASIYNVVGKALVLYDVAGRQVACAVIQPNKTLFDTDGSVPVAVVALAGSGPSPGWWALAASVVLARAAL